MFYFRSSRLRRLWAEARKDKLVQNVMAVREPPAHARSSCRKGVNSTAGLGWPCLTLSPVFRGAAGHLDLTPILHRSNGQLTNFGTAHVVSAASVDVVPFLPILAADAKTLSDRVRLA